MPIKASLKVIEPRSRRRACGVSLPNLHAKREAKAFYITFTPGMRVSLIQGEYSYEPRRPHMTAAQKQEFASASARLTNNALLDALESIAGDLQDAGLRAEDVITIIDVVELARAVIRGRSLVTGLNDEAYVRVYSMMGEPLEAPSTPSFDFDNAMKDMGQNER